MTTFSEKLVDFLTKDQLTELLSLDGSMESFLEGFKTGKGLSNTVKILDQMRPEQQVSIFSGHSNVHHFLPHREEGEMQGLTEMCRIMKGWTSEQRTTVLEGGLWSMIHFAGWPNNYYGQIDGLVEYISEMDSSQRKRIHSDRCGQKLAEYIESKNVDCNQKAIFRQLEQLLTDARPPSRHRRVEKTPFVS